MEPKDFLEWFAEHSVGHYFSTGYHSTQKRHFQTFSISSSIKTENSIISNVLLTTPPPPYHWKPLRTQAA